MEFASKLEQRYSQHLNSLVASGDILYHHFEPLKFIIGESCTYRPDFLVARPDGRVEFHEVKGFLRDDANVKFRAAGSLNPWAVFIMVTWDKKANDWREMIRLNDGPGVMVAATRTPTTVKAATPSKGPSSPPVGKPGQYKFNRNQTASRMSYTAMLASPGHAVVLRMKPSELQQLRIRLGKDCADMDRELDLPYPGCWAKFESGALKLYHQKHVEALMRYL